MLGLWLRWGQTSRRGQEILTCGSTLWLRTRRKSLEFAEIRQRLQDAEVELIKLCQSVPKSPSKPLVLRSGERRLVLEMLPEVDLSSRPRVPEFMVTWV